MYLIFFLADDLELKASGGGSDPIKIIYIEVIFNVPTNSTFGDTLGFNRISAL